jgi:uncharacterized protein (TIGR03382 family)
MCEENSMPGVARRKATAYAAATVAAGALAAITTFASPAYAGGPTTPFSGRTEGGSLILKDGDIIACAAVGQLQVVQTNGVIRDADGAGTMFTTPEGTMVKTLRKGTVKATVNGASATVTCGKEGFPTTSAFVPTISLKDGVETGSGGAVSGVNTAGIVGGSALAAAGLAGGAALLRRRRADSGARL